MPDSKNKGTMKCCQEQLPQTSIVHLLKTCLLSSIHKLFRGVDLHPPFRHPCPKTRQMLFRLQSLWVKLSYLLLKVEKCLEQVSMNAVFICTRVVHKSWNMFWPCQNFFLLQLSKVPFHFKIYWPDTKNNCTMLKRTLSLRTTYRSKYRHCNAKKTMGEAFNGWKTWDKVVQSYRQ